MMILPGKEPDLKIGFTTFSYLFSPQNTENLEKVNNFKPDSSDNPEKLRALSGISFKESKFFDHQGLIFLHVLKGLLSKVQVNKTHSPLYLSVGPARTELETLISWAERISESELSGEKLYPAVQPASAIGLLPNSALSMLSIQLKWHGEGNVFSGFSESGMAAIKSALEALYLGTDSALVSASSYAENHFVQKVMKRGFYESIIPPSPVGIAAHFTKDSSDLSLRGLISFPSSIEIDSAIEQCSKIWRINQETFLKSLFLEDFFGKRQLSETFGDLMCAGPLFVFSLAEKNFFGKGLIPVVFRDHFHNISAFLLEVL
ncbi:MAG: hypothetical protein HQM08_09255 [Candidatus Riflebacteria bacterium]|nr:hypothetical protein [Candidatus Riflebacteria bacterium]